MYEIDELQVNLQESYEEHHLKGFTDGSHGYPLQIKHMHELTYLRGYAIGITQWIKELERREQENYANSVFKF